MKLKGCVIHVLLLAIMVFSTCSWAASPSYDCNRAKGRVELSVCQDEELANYDRVLGDSYRKYLKTLSLSDSEALKKGESAWIKYRNSYCERGLADIDRNCIVNAYRGRIASLDSLLGNNVNPGEWSKEGKYWVQLASRSSLDDAIILANRLSFDAKYYKPFIVMLSLNGWYAVSVGPYSREDAASVIQDIQVVSPYLAEEEPIPTKGERYALRIYYSGEEIPDSVKQPDRNWAPIQPVPRASGACSKSDIRVKQAVCVTAFAGEAVCQEELAKISRAEGVASGAAVAAACSAASSALLNGSIDPESLIGSAFRGGLATLGASMNQEGNGLITRAFGFFLSGSVVTYEVSQVIDCIRNAERQCR